MTVYATEPWQDTFVPLNKLRSVQYLEGECTVNYRNLKTWDHWVDANGYNRRAPIDNALPGARNGGLIGRGSDRGGAFYIGNWYSGRPSGSGTLMLAINDALGSDGWGGVDDNDGAVVVLIESCQ